MPTRCAPADSFDGGRSWRRTAPTFSHCAGGNAANGGDYQRASDPWVSLGPTGIAHQISLSFDNYHVASGDPREPLAGRRANLEPARPP